MTRHVSEGATSVLDAASKVAGVVAARGRGDADGARELLASFDSHEQLADGALLVADLALRALSDNTGESMDEIVRVMHLRLMSIQG